MKNKEKLPVLAVLLAGVATSPVLAQDGARKNELVLEEIIVTAEKREQSLQDVPISISVLNEERLEQVGIDEVEDLGANVPNLAVSPFNSDSNTVRLLIRGIGLNDVQLTQDPAVALYMDGVYVGTAIGLGFENTDIERIEVLRGPQGTLYGRNATGGAVNIITASPELGEFAFKQVFTGGNLGQFKSRTRVNIPLGEGAAVKLSYLKSERDGIVDNTAAGLDWGVQDRDAYRVSLLVQPGDSLAVNYSYDKSESADTDNFGQNVVARDTGFPAGLPLDLSTLPIPGFSMFPPGAFFALPYVSSTVVQPVQPTRLDSFQAIRPLFANKLDVDGHSLTLSWQASDHLTVKTISSLRQIYNNSFSDLTPGIDAGATLQLLQPTPLGGPVPAPAGTVLPLAPGVSGSVAQLRRATDFEQTSHEIQFIGNVNSLAEYVAGVYYYEDEAVQNGTDGFAFTMREDDFTSSENDSIAVYGQATITPGGDEGRWHYTLGARYSKDDRKAFRDNPNSDSFVASAPEGANYARSFTNFNPSLTVAYDLNEQSNVYAKVVSGFRSGGTSNRSANATLFQQGTDEEDIISYELGYKGLLLDSRVELNAALFQMDIDGYQSSQQTGATPGDRDFIGIDGVKSKGVEMDVRALLSENLTLSVALGLLDTDTGVTSVTVPGDAVRQLIGELAYAPEESATVTLDYNRPIGDKVLTGYLGYSYQSDHEASNNVAEQATLGSRGLLNASLSLSEISLGSGALSVSLWGRNLTDEDYKTVATNISPFAPEISIFGDPRIYGLNLAYEY